VTKEDRHERAARDMMAVYKAGCWITEADIVNAVAEVGHGYKFGLLDATMQQNAVDIARDAIRRAEDRGKAIREAGAL
jgi:hypothetical protein